MPIRKSEEEAYNPLTWEPSLVFLKYAVWGILVSVVVVCLAMYFLVPTLKDRALWPAPMAIVGLVGWMLMRRGKTQAAIASMATGIWVCVAGLVYVGGGITAPVQYVFPLVIFMLGWLTSARAAFLTAGVTAAFTTAMVMLEARGDLPPAPFSPPSLLALVQICVFLMAAVLVFALVRAYQRRLLDLNTVNAHYVQRTNDLEHTKLELHQAQAVAKVGSWVYQIETDTLYPSNETCRILGLPNGSTLDLEGYLRRTHPDDRDTVRATISDVLRDHTPFDAEHRIRYGNTTTWVRQKAQFASGQDRPNTRILGITQDINERKLAELSLQQSEKKFATAFQSSPVAASIATMNHGRFLEANDKYARDFGWKREELIHRTTSDIHLWPTPDLRVQWLEALKARGNLVDYETTWVHRNGSLRSVSISCEIIDYEHAPCILAYITDITERKAAEAQIQNLAFFDALTGLPNRRLLTSRLEQSLASTQRHLHLGSVLFIDIDKFKTINDAHGHAKGDLLLKQVAQRLTECVREGDTVARLGGDEFVVMLDSLSEDALIAASQAESVAEKIRLALDQNYQFAEVLFHSTASIGVALFGEQADGLDDPLTRASTAMYQAKAAGRNTIRFFDPQMQEAISALVQLEMELRSAVSNNHFLLLYQPQINGTGQVTGAEALVRWRHPLRGLVSPIEFIRVVESNDLILPLGAWILEDACTQLTRWATLAGFAHLTLAVNVSARQFQQPDFVPQVLAVLQRTGANPQRLKLEITESMLIDDVAAVIEKMTALKAHGVAFSLDDFGTGYSSLSYLKQLPLDQLKIDRSFVHDVLTDPNDVAIARMVIVLAETLGLSVIAEGVETAAQQALLASQGCHNFQGFHISRPVTGEQFETFVRERS